MLMPRVSIAVIFEVSDRTFLNFRRSCLFDGIVAHGFHCIPKP